MVLPMHSELRSLQDAVAEGFKGACARVIRERFLSDEIDPLPILYLLLDHTLLLATSHIYLTVSAWDAAGKLLRTFSSLSPQDRAYLDLPKPRPETLRRNIVARRAIDDKEVLLSFHEVPGDETGLRTASDPVFMSGVQRLLDLGKGLTLSALERLASDYPSEATATAATVVVDEVWRRQIDLIRRRLDGVLTSWGKCQLFPRDEEGRTRLFVGFRQPLTTPHWKNEKAARNIRRADGHDVASYGYTTRIFLTPTQQAERGLTEEELATLNSLGQGERAIADTPLTTGIIDVGFPRERDANNQNCREHYLAIGVTDGLRALEDKIYGAKSRSESIFYIPIHIGGVPWLALFTFLPEPSDDDENGRLERMWQRYWIYRDVAPALAGELSQGVAQAFAAALAEAARDHFDVLHDAEFFAARVTKSWKDMSAVFPYGEPKISVAEGKQSLPISLRLAGQSHKFYISVASNPEVAYRLLDLDLVRGLVELRLQAAIEARAQERNTLTGLAVHEWVSKLSDGIVRSEKLKEAAIAADVDDSLMDHIYGLYGTLQGDIGLPWIIDQSQGSKAYFTSRAPDEQDVWFLRTLFEFHVRAILSARTAERQAVKFNFTCPSFTAADCQLIFRPNESGLASVGRKLEDLWVSRPCPWPLHESVGTTLTTREGLVSALTLAPRELLRNALRHGDAQGHDQEIIFETTVNLEDGKWQINGSVRNSVPPRVDVEKRVADVRQRCAQLQTAVPFVRCALHYHAERSEFDVRYSFVFEAMS